MLNSNGFLITRQSDTHQKTVIVLGVARGGTSLAAGLLDAMAIPMGDEGTPPLFEDDQLTRAIRNPRRQRSTSPRAKDYFVDIAAEINQLLRKSKLSRKTADEVIADYNARFDIWGYKKPSAYDWITAHYRKFRNPVFVLIMKDPIAIAVRKNNLYDYEAQTSLTSALKQYEKMLRFLAKSKLPAFIFSYEKLMADPAALLPQLCTFLGIPEDRIENALAFIAKGSGEYNALFENQMTRRKNAIEGHLDVVNSNMIAGWAMDVSNHNAPIDITITVNDTLLCEARADNHRLDLASAGIHATGNCGFCVHLNDQQAIADGSIIRAFAGENRTELSRSPWVYHSV